LQVLEMTDLPRRPAHLHILYAVDLKAEVDPGVRGRLVAAAAGFPGAVAPAADRDRDDRTQGIAIGASAFEAEGREVAARCLIVKINQRAALGDRDEVAPAVVVHVARGETAAEARGDPGFPGGPGDVDQPTARAADQEQARHLEGEIGAAVDHMAV